MQDLTSQFFAFFVTVLTGFLLGLFFDVYRVGREIIRPGRIINHLSDLLFWLISTGFVFLLLLFGNWGEVRLYVFIGAGLGLFIYLQWFSRLTVKLLVLLLKLLRYVKNIIIIPVGFISSMVTTINNKICLMFRRLIGIPVKRGWQQIKRKLRRVFFIF